MFWNIGKTSLFLLLYMLKLLLAVIYSPGFLFVFSLIRQNMQFVMFQITCIAQNQPLGGELKGLVLPQCPSINVK